MPLSTRMLIWTSRAMQHFGLHAVFVFIAVIFSGIYFYKKSAGFNFWLDNLIMRLPVISHFIRIYMLASISNVVGLLLANNASLVSGLSVARDTANNKTYANALDKVITDISAGLPISAAFLKFPRLFPEEYRDILSIGERTGKLSETFVYAQVLYTRDLDNLTKSLSASIEPILMVFIGLAIGVVALSVVTPMYGLTSHLHG